MKSYSMKSSLLITIIVMGLLSVGFTLFTGEIYLQQTLDNRRQTFTEVVELEVHNLWDNLKLEAKSLGLSVQSNKGFRAAFLQRNKRTIDVQLNEHFDRAFVTLGILNLKKIIVYDKSLNKIFQSSKGDEVDGDVCSSVIVSAKNRSGPDRFKTLHNVCEFKGQIRLVTLVPVGGLRLKGYLLVVVDPLNNLSKSEEGLGIPVMIKNPQGMELFRSANWPEKNRMENIMLVHYGNRAGNKKPVANFYFASDVALLKKNLTATRISLVSFVIISTLFATLVALALFRKTIINPLNKINTYMDKIRNDKRHLREELDVVGSKELVSLANQLNGLSDELSHLYNELEEKAFTDSLTGIPNRALLFDRLEQVTLLAKRDKSRSEFMIMMMDLNKFKVVNDELGHHIGDGLLTAVAGRLKQALRESDTVSRIGGDEFAIILYAVNEKEIAISVAEKITALMDKNFNIEGHEIDVGMSIGIARFPYDGNSGEQLMHSADIAMYHSKRNKLSYVFYDEKLADSNN
ncbi:MAG: diguanylate cyclase [Gammaproteobacteria bacterium]|nr:diguanylate cyclase [Gammaproteobacteria bacterium]